VKAPASIRFTGPGKPPRVAPFGLPWTDDGVALAVQVTSETSLDELPEASSLSPQTLVVVLPEPAKRGGLLAAFGRRTVSRRARCGALLVRGYVDIGAEVDPASRLDLAFGRVP
jgi:hypothetical protein